MLIVTNGLVQSPDGLKLHPLLESLRGDLLRRSRSWYAAPTHTPLSFTAWLAGRSPAAMLATGLHLPDSVQQCWVASPFYAQLLRDRLQVMPDGAFSWGADDASSLAALLNPLLAEEGMSLYAAGSALILTCDKPIDASPASFAEVSGHLLPNRHPDGADGGRLMRLVAELQMFLYRNPLMDRRSRNEPDVRGIWLWGHCGRDELSPASMPIVATRSPSLLPAVDGRNAKLSVTEVERLEAMLNPHAGLPEDVLLMGDGHALWLRQTPFTAMLARLGRKREASLPVRLPLGQAELLQAVRAHW